MLLLDNRISVLMCKLQLLCLMLLTPAMGMNVARKVVIVARELHGGLQTGLDTWTCLLQNHRSQLLLRQHVQHHMSGATSVLKLSTTRYQHLL